jgi:hypothetical protein
MYMALSYPQESCASLAILYGESLVKRESKVRFTVCDFPLTTIKNVRVRQSSEDSSLPRSSRLLSYISHPRAHDRRHVSFLIVKVTKSKRAVNTGARAGHPFVISFIHPTGNGVF